jgi:hypothetical protein
MALLLATGGEAYKFKRSRFCFITAEKYEF